MTICLKSAHFNVKISKFYLSKKLLFLYLRSSSLYEMSHKKIRQKNISPELSRSRKLFCSYKIDFEVMKSCLYTFLLSSMIYKLVKN